MNVRVQTTGEVTATAAMRDALLDIISVCDHVHDTFDSAVEEFKAKNPLPWTRARGEESWRAAAAGGGAFETGGSSRIFRIVVLLLNSH